jgi:signal recognition particle subunit SRP54
MFDALSDRVEGIFGRLRGKGRLSEDDIDEVLREIRMALLEADVNFGVVRGFQNRVRERCVGAEMTAYFFEVNCLDWTRQAVDL